MKHPYEILKENIAKYSQILKIEDIKQIKPNHFLIQDENFEILLFLNDVSNATNILPLEHAYLTTSCDVAGICAKPYVVYGFDNVLFYFINKNY